MSSSRNHDQSSTTGLATISTVPEVRIFYDITPPLPIDPLRPVIVLSNSLGASTSLWDEFVATFAPTHTILRYDARFHGSSPLSQDESFDYNGAFTIEQLADDVVSLLGALKIEGPLEAFIGLSIGAGVGVVLASRHPSLFNRFIIVGTKSHASPADAERFQERIQYIQSHGAQAQAQQSLERWFDSTWIQANPDLAKAFVNMVAATPVEGFVTSMSALQTLDLRPHIQNIKQKQDGDRLLFAVGEKDGPIVVEETHQLAEQAGSKVVIVQDAGHIVNAQQPKRFNDIVRNYLQVSI